MEWYSDIREAHFTYDHNGEVAALRDDAPGWTLYTTWLMWDGLGPSVETAKDEAEQILGLFDDLGGEPVTIEWNERPDGHYMPTVLGEVTAEGEKGQWMVRLPDGEAAGPFRTLHAARWEVLSRSRSFHPSCMPADPPN